MEFEDTTGKVIKCRAAVAWEPNKPLSIEEIEVDVPRACEIRVQMVSSGICRSDASVLNGSFQFSNKFPIILGHEGAGVVESVGYGVTTFQPGDYVIPLYVPQCFICDACMSRKTNLCELMNKMHPNCCMTDGTTRFKCRGIPLNHFVCTSTFSEYTVVAEACLTKIHKHAPLETVCLIGCAISTGYGAVLNAAKVEPGSSCAVWGLGGVGLAVAMSCRIAGATKIYGIDINPAKSEIAKKFGCTDFINPTDYKGRKIQDVLMEMTNGGFDYTFECIGNPDTMRAAFESSKITSGMNILVGIAAHDKVLNIIPHHVTFGRTLKGTFFGGWKSVDSVPRIVREYMNNRIMVDEFITNTITLDKINEGFEMMAKGEGIRTVILL